MPSLSYAIHLLELTPLHLLTHHNRLGAARLSIPSVVHLYSTIINDVYERSEGPHAYHFEFIRHLYRNVTIAEKDRFFVDMVNTHVAPTTTRH